MSKYERHNEIPLLYLTRPHCMHNLGYKPSPSLLIPRLHKMIMLDIERGKTTAERGYSMPASKHGSS